MTETKAEYVTEAEDERKHYHDCGHLIGIVVNGVLIRNHEPVFAITYPCPQCGEVITWRADKLYHLIRHWDRVWSGILADLEAPLVILEENE